MPKPEARLARPWCAPPEGTSAAARSAVRHRQRRHGAGGARAGRVVVHPVVRVVVATDAPLGRLGRGGQDRVGVVPVHRADERRREDAGQRLVVEGPGSVAPLHALSVEDARLAAQGDGELVPAAVGGMVAAEPHAQVVVVHHQQAQRSGVRRRA